ncbi:hypothetical protein GW17_00049814 [Ensete ventricosum]|nr:hypothetical protein GW17_00049814 [Ensete ventricosum]RZS16913.1 hypothetical protein BHM03_00048986 [Ensete ventricosum]
MPNYKKAITRLYNKGIQPRGIGLTNLIQWNVEINDLTCSQGKLAPNWKGPYKVIEMV